MVRNSLRLSDQRLTNTDGTNTSYFILMVISLHTGREGAGDGWMYESSAKLFLNGNNELLFSEFDVIYLSDNVKVEEKGYDKI